MNAYVSPLSDMSSELPKLGFRINDGSGDYYWDGADWIAPPGDDWSGADDLKDHFKDYPFNKVSVKVKIPLDFASKLSRIMIGYTVKQLWHKLRRDFNENCKRFCSIDLRWILNGFNVREKADSGGKSR